MPHASAAGLRRFAALQEDAFVAPSLQASWNAVAQSQGMRIGKGDARPAAQLTALAHARAYASQHRTCWPPALPTGPGHPRSGDPGPGDPGPGGPA